MFRTSLVASAFAALTAFIAVAPAYAGEKDQSALARREKRNHDPKKFVERVNARIARMVEMATKRIEADRSMTAARKRVAVAQVKASAEAVRVATAAARKNGTVTKAEAQAIRAIVKAEAKKIRDMVPGGHHGKGHKRPHRRGTQS